MSPAARVSGCCACRCAVVACGRVRMPHCTRRAWVLGLALGSGGTSVNTPHTSALDAPLLPGRSQPSRTLCSPDYSGQAALAELSLCTTLPRRPGCGTSHTTPCYASRPMRTNNPRGIMARSRIRNHATSHDTYALTLPRLKYTRTSLVLLRHDYSSPVGVFIPVRAMPALGIGVGLALAAWSLCSTCSLVYPSQLPQYPSRTSSGWCVVSPQRGHVSDFTTGPISATVPRSRCAGRLLACDGLAPFASPLDPRRSPSACLMLNPAASIASRSFAGAAMYPFIAHRSASEGS